MKSGGFTRDRARVSRLLVHVLALFFLATLNGCAVAAEIVFRTLGSPGFWSTVDHLGQSSDRQTDHFFDGALDPAAPVVDSLSEDARFVASSLASCPLDDVRVVRRRRRRFTLVACGRTIILRCRAPRDGSPTRCREVHPIPETGVASVSPTLVSEGVRE